VIYDAGMGRQWLEQVRSLLDIPCCGTPTLPSERMEAHEVSTLVNLTENDSAAVTVSPSTNLAGFNVAQARSGLSTR
jgi:hypothetical protein